MVNRFNSEIGYTMKQADIDTVVSYMDGIDGIDQNLAGILAAIEMAK